MGSAHLLSPPPPPNLRSFFNASSILASPVDDGTRSSARSSTCSIEGDIPIFRLAAYDVVADAIDDDNEPLEIRLRILDIRRSLPGSGLLREGILLVTHDLFPSGTPLEDMDEAEFIDDRVREGIDP